MKQAFQIAAASLLALIAPVAAQAQTASTTTSNASQQSRAEAPAFRQGVVQAPASSSYRPTLSYGQGRLSSGYMLPAPSGSQMGNPQTYFPSGQQPYIPYGQPYIPVNVPAYIPLPGSNVLAGYPYGPASLPGQQPYVPAYNSGSAYGGSTSYFYGSGYYYPDYCQPGYGEVVYPSVYSLYDGFPGYFYTPDNSLIVLSGGPTVVNPYDGESYSFSNDPYSDTSYSDSNAESGALPESWGNQFAQIGQAWATHNLNLLDQYLPAGNETVAVGLNNSYAYSLGATDYQLMTRDAMSRLNTSDFRFTDAHVRPNGEATAYAIQRYNSASGGSGTVYLAYTLRRDRTLASGYRLVGVNTSIQPQTARQRVWATRASGNSTIHYGN